MEEKKRESLLEKIKRHDAEFDEQIKQMNEEIEELKKKVLKGKYKKVEEQKEETSFEAIETQKEETSFVSKKKESLLEKIKRREAGFDEQIKQLGQEIEMLKKKVLKGRDKKVEEREEEASLEIAESPKKKETFLEEIERHALEFDEKIKKMRGEIEVLVKKVFGKREK
jgi:chromosome segregation ATPase